MATAARFDNAERQTRYDLAACYRLAARFGMTDTIYTHISARIPGTEDILINRFGDQFHEVTASRCQADGLRPISQYSLQFYNRVAYHDYEGIALLDDEKPRLVNDLGTHGALILRNHGLLTAYATIPETFAAMYNLERACQVQIAAMSGGARLYPVAEHVRERTARQCENFGGQDTGLPEWIALVRDLEATDPDFAD